MINSRILSTIQRPNTLAEISIPFVCDVSYYISLYFCLLLLKVLVVLLFNLAFAITPFWDIPRRVFLFHLFDIF